MFGSIENLFDINVGSLEGGFEVVVTTVTALLGEFAGSLGGGA